MKGINDLARHIEPMKRELQAAVTEVLGSGWYILGPKVGEFETAFARYCGVAHCVSVANGTDALELALRALGIGPGAFVATVANAGMYSTTAIRAVGATPAFVDIDAESLLMDADALDRLLASQRVDAVIATHLYGAMGDVRRFARACSNAGVALIEDCAQAHGAEMAGTRAGAFSDAGCYSFYPTKNLGALGDGGAVVTSRDDLAERLRRLRQYGWTSKYASADSGGRNSRLDEMQAAILCVMLPHLDRWNARRREIARTYSSEIRNTRVRCPGVEAVSGDGYVGHLYVVRAQDRDDLKRHLSAHAIPFDVHYPIPDHLQRSLDGAFAAAILPATERACKEVITLPIFPEMTDEEQRQVVGCVNSW